MENTLDYTAIRKPVETPAILTRNHAESITYSLTAGNPDSQAYYDDIAQFTDRVLVKAQKRLQPIVTAFEAYIRETGCEALHSPEEYLLEALTLGVLWNVYAVRAMSFSPVLSSVFRTLLALRRRYRWLKSGVDRVRGILTTLFLMPRSPARVQSHPWDVRHLDTLLNWLTVTGEFRQEVKRLRTWQRFFETLPSERVADMLEAMIACALWFELQARKTLGVYTCQVEPFLRYTHPQHYRWREDILFCGRQEVEYHLIMVGAEILNRALQNDFLKTPRKAVLLPTCMRGRSAAECRARKEGLNITCQGCTADCRIHQITTLGKRAGFEVFMIPHTSDFSRWLERWRDTREVGVIGVACILNLFTGGYEMKDRNIPSQCVLLDYCGCQNHWHPNGLPTDLNRDQLIRVIHTIHTN